MQGKQLRQLEAELWRAADQLRANSKLTASEMDAVYEQQNKLIILKSLRYDR
jgi:hypothetical protein